MCTLTFEQIYCLNILFLTLIPWSFDMHVTCKKVLQLTQLICFMGTCPTTKKASWPKWKMRQLRIADFIHSVQIKNVETQTDTYIQTLHNKDSWVRCFTSLHACLRVTQGNVMWIMTLLHNVLFHSQTPWLLWLVICSCSIMWNDIIHRIGSA